MTTADAYAAVGRRYRDADPADHASYRQLHRKMTGRYATLADYGYHRANAYRAARRSAERQARIAAARELQAAEVNR